MTSVERPPMHDLNGSTHDLEIRKLIDRASHLARAEHTEQVSPEATRARLNAHGIDDAEIARQLSTLKWNTAANETAAITTYSYLHGLQHLDDIARKTGELGHSASAVLALFRSAEICLYTIDNLSTRMLANLQGGRIGEALANVRWRAGLQQLLYNVSLLVVEANPGGVEGSTLGIRHSALFQRHQASSKRLHVWLAEHWPEHVDDIFGKDIDDPKRNVFFHEFVNTGDQRVWESLLAHVTLPGVHKSGDESDATFYARMVRGEDIVRMEESMETHAETDLLPFRVVHQVTEVVASVVNAIACDAVKGLLTAPPAGMEAVVRGMILGNRLLSLVDDAIKLMGRCLTPHAYSAVRPNLGMVRGTSSRVLRKTLFNNTYPLLVKAFKLRITGASVTEIEDDALVHRAATELLRGRGEVPQLAAILQQLVVLHQHVRTWRDNHIQLPKTHLGVSDVADRPTVSLSGSDSAVDIAHELRKTHETDPIVPLHRALLGSAPPGVHEMLSDGGFDAHAAHATARAVFGVYEEVQERFYRRCPVAHGNPPASHD